MTNQPIDTKKLREYLAIAADLATVFGVSVAATATAIFSLNEKIDVWNAVFATSQTLVFLAAFSISLIFARAVWRYVGGKFQSDPFNRRAFLFATLMLFLSVAIIFGMLFYEYLSSFRYLQ